MVIRNEFTGSPECRDEDLNALLEHTVDQLLSNRLTTTSFERAVGIFWDAGRFIQRYPRPSESDIAARIGRIAQDRPALNYSSAHGAEFRVKFLFGVANQPGAIHIEAPGEAIDSNLPSRKNRPPHTHQTGRISIITTGCATLLVHRRVRNIDYVIEAPVRKNDIIFWGPRVAHTFDAGRDGFSLLSAMSVYMSPEDKTFARPSLDAGIDFDQLPKLEYANYEAKLSPEIAVNKLVQE